MKSTVWSDGRLTKLRKDRLEPPGNKTGREMQDGRVVQVYVMWIKNVDAMNKNQTPVSRMAGKKTIILV